MYFTFTIEINADLRSRIMRREKSNSVFFVFQAAKTVQLNLSHSQKQLKKIKKFFFKRFWNQESSINQFPDVFEYNSNVCFITKGSISAQFYFILIIRRSNDAIRFNIAKLNTYHAKTKKKKLKSKFYLFNPTNL